MVFEGGTESSQSKFRFVAQHEINDNWIYGTQDLSIAAMSLFLSCETINKDFVLDEDNASEITLVLFVYCEYYP